jgi:hypothetical protein
LHLFICSFGLATRSIKSIYHYKQYSKIDFDAIVLTIVANGNIGNYPAAFIDDEIVSSMSLFVVEAVFIHTFSHYYFLLDLQWEKNYEK